MHTPLKIFLVSLAIALTYLPGQFALAAGAPTKDAVIPFDQIKFFPVNPAQPDGLQMGLVSGDPQKGPASFYLKLKPGASAIHSHTSTYEGLTVKGPTKHWVNGTEADAPAMEPGSYWKQIGKEDHGDSCLAKDFCLIFLRFTGKFDFIPAKK